MKNIFRTCITAFIITMSTVAQSQEYEIYDEVVMQHTELPKTLEGPCVFWSGPVSEGPANYIGWLENNATKEKWLFARVGDRWLYQSRHPLHTAKLSCYGMV